MATEHGKKGGRLAAFFPGGRRLGVEALVIGGLIVLVAFLVYHFTVHTIRNERPLGGPNVNVVPVDFDQTHASFAVDPTDPKAIFGASNDTGLETVRVYESRDNGATWRNAPGPVVAGGSCAHGAPSVAVDAKGRQYLAFLASQYCGDSLTPYLVITSRAGAGDPWEPLVRVARPTWKYGFDDAPKLSLDESTGHLYVAWTRSLSKTLATTVVSTSTDAGRTWSAPKPVSDALQSPRRASIAVAPSGDVYITGIDAKIGLWVSRSNDGARTFSTPRPAARLLANPAGRCALTANDPLPRELSACDGPDPTISVGKNRVTIVYSDVGADQSNTDIFAASLDLSLTPAARVQVNPPEKKATLQFIPTSTLDPTTGVLWACWYDTTFDSHAHRAWFTCSASRDGRTWSAPERAAKDPTSATILYGTLGTNGLVPSATARNGVAHVFWGDGRIINDRMDIFTAALPERGAFAVGKP